MRPCLEKYFFLTSTFEFISPGLKCDKWLLHFFPNFMPVCISETQHLVPVTCLSGPNPDVSTIENTFISLKIQGAGEILQIILGQGHFWYFLSELFLLNSPQSPSEAWESALDRCWQPLPGSSPRQGTGHSVTWPCHGRSFLMAPHKSWPPVFQTKHSGCVMAVLGSGRTRSERAQPESISLYLPGLCWKCACLVESFKMDNLYNEACS